MEDESVGLELMDEPRELMDDPGLIERAMTERCELSDRARKFIADGQARYRTVNCFDFVPSNYQIAWQVLNCLPRGRFCEWGSGFGIATGLAELLGFDAIGIERDPQLAMASRSLLADHQLKSQIMTTSYFEANHTADVYYVYCWPSLINQTEDRFVEIAPPHAKLVICYGQDDFRCKCRKY